MFGRTSHDHIVPKKGFNMGVLKHNSFAISKEEYCSKVYCIAAAEVNAHLDLWEY